MTTKPRLLIFVVAYFAERTIARVLSRVPAALADNYDAEILIIDDGSHDGTFEAGFHASGPCTYADPDGDLIFSTFDIRGGGGKAPAGTKEYIGGTGKYVGLTGHATFTIASLKPMDKTSPETFEGHVQGTYRLGSERAAGTAR